MQIPKTYLSTSEGTWRVIHQGLPLCANTTYENAAIVAERYGYKPSEMAVWNGDYGKFCPATGREGGSPC